jgi:hypothetical protein
LEIGFSLGKMAHFPKKHTFAGDLLLPREWPFSSMNGIISLGFFFKNSRNNKFPGEMGTCCFFGGGKKN